MDDDARDIVLGIYDAVATPAKWAPVLDRVADRVKARGCIVFEMAGHGDARTLSASHLTSDYEQELLDGYLARFGDLELEDQDMFEAHSLASDGIDLIDDSVLAETDEALFARPNAKALLNFNIRHRAAGLLNKDNRMRSRFSVQLPADGGRLSDAARSDLGLFLPHIAKALELGRPSLQLAALHAGLLAAMDRLRVGLCIVDRERNVLAQNSEFQRQCDAYAVLGLDPRGRLVVPSAQMVELEALLADCAAHGRHGARPRKEALMLGSTPDEGAICLEIAPLDYCDEIGSRPVDGAIIYALDTRNPMQFDVEAVSALYGLTTAETELTRLLSEGLTNSQIAERRARSVDTVNAQVKSVLSKTNCANRTQLVRLLGGFCGSWLAG